MLHIVELNHIGLWVKDVSESVSFYSEILELEQLERPAFDFDGAWFRLGTHQELHLLEGRNTPVISHSRKVHFALRVKSIKETESFLLSKGLDIIGPKKRPDGAWQIFISDPDGYWMEFSEIH